MAKSDSLSCGPAAVTRSDQKLEEYAFHFEVCFMKDHQPTIDPHRCYESECPHGCPDLTTNSFERFSAQASTPFRFHEQYAWAAVKGVWSSLFALRPWVSLAKAREK